MLWDQDKEPLGAGKFRSMCLGPYVMSKILKKGAYELTRLHMRLCALLKLALYIFILSFGLHTRLCTLQLMYHT